MKKIIIKKIKSNFLFIFLKSVRTSLHTINYVKKNRSNFLYLFNFFIIRSIFGLQFFRNKIGYRKTQDVIESNNFKCPIKKNMILESLVERGFSDTFNLKDTLKENLLFEIMQNLINSRIIFKDKSVEKKEVIFESKNDIDKYLTKNNVHMIKSFIDINKTNLLNKIFTDAFFTKLAKDYLNSDKLTLNHQFFISAANNQLVDNFNKDELLSLSAQAYHFDVDFKKFFKIFVYFSDVLEEANGSHIYVPKTHSQKKTDHMITSRFQNSDIEKNYDPKNVFLGEAGTAFVVDTFGIHKGSPVTKGTRLALILEYGRGHFPISPDYKYI